MTTGGSKVQSKTFCLRIGEMVQFSLPYALLVYRKGGTSSLLNAIWKYISEYYFQANANMKSPYSLPDIFLLFF